MKRKPIPTTLADLRRITPAEPQIIEVMNRFLDFMELNSDYRDTGKPSRNDTIQRMIAKVTAKTLKVNSSYLQMREMGFTEHLDDNFYHGSFKTNGYIVSFFFFSDLKIGCLSASDLTPKSDVTLCARLTPAPMKKKRKLGFRRK